MIVSKLIGGLGNQMFQYANGLALSKRNNDQFYIDTELLRGGEGVTGRNFELNIFGINFFEVDRLNRDLFLKQKILGVLLKKYFGLSYRYILENSFSFDPSILKIKNSVYLDGYWQSEKYFIEYEKEVRSDFTFKRPLFGKNKDIAEDIDRTNSVSLHVRRGDYVDNEIVNKFHGTCDLNYYQKAIDLIGNRVKNPKFFVFSDDIKWVKDNLKIKNAIYVEGNIGNRSYVDMQLMSLCKHNIIANSSFSWWGAWLNSNPNEIVIAPKKWFNDPSINTKDLIPEKWIRI